MDRTSSAFCKRSLGYAVSTSTSFSACWMVSSLNSREVFMKSSFMRERAFSAFFSRLGSVFVSRLARYSELDEESPYRLAEE